MTFFNYKMYLNSFVLNHKLKRFPFSVPSQGLLKTKQNEDPGFEIIKEVPGSGKTPFGMFNNPSLSALATLMGAGGAGPNLGMGSHMMNQSNILKNCE